MQRLTYYLFLLLIHTFGRLPFPILYQVAKGIGWILYHIVGYRKKVIAQNLEICFPEKSEEERQRITKDFYIHLSGLTLESLKQWTMSKEEVLERCKIYNPEIFKPYFEKGQSLVCAAAHYSHWEWSAPSTAMQLDHHIIGIYKAIKNPYINERVLGLREKYGIEFVDTSEAYQVIEANEKAGNVCMYVLLSDQSPSYLDKSYWVDFFGHSTPCIKGPEKIAKQYNLPVLYGESRMVKKGFYELVFKTLSDHPQENPHKEITQMMMKEVERQIRHIPATWLWSHRRWKRLPEGVKKI